MDRLIYVAMTGAKQLTQAQALVANNLANLNTEGFRADLARFESSPIGGAGYPSRVNTVASGLGFDHTPGTLLQTGRELDVAIDGPGWVAVQAPDGAEVYTRGGSLNVNALGLLQTARGELVLGDNGPVSVPPHVQLAVGRDGTVSVVPQGQGPETLAQVGRIKLVNPDPATLEKRPDGLVRLADGSTAEPDAAVKITSGYVESSNVNAAQAMVSMIEIARQFEVEVRMMKVADDNATRATELAAMS
jgi:flagellar basal-body rod protein FlgF